EYPALAGGARFARRPQLQTAELRLGPGDDAWLLQQLRTGRANSEFSIAPMFVAVQAGLDSVNIRPQGPSCPAGRGKPALRCHSWAGRSQGQAREPGPPADLSAGVVVIRNGGFLRSAAPVWGHGPPNRREQAARASPAARPHKRDARHSREGANPSVAGCLCAARMRIRARPRTTPGARYRPAPLRA